MADAKRDRTVISTAWLAHWAIEGDEDPAFIGEYLEEAFGVLERVTDPSKLDPQDAKALSDLKVFLLSMRRAADPNGSSPMELRLDHRKTSPSGGRRRLSFDEVRRRREAGAKAYRYKFESHLSKDEAITRAWADMRADGTGEGLSERIIAREYDRHRRAMKALESANNLP